MILNRTGYSLPKNDPLCSAFIDELKQELTVKPKVNEEFGKASEFPVWRENTTRFYVPKHYGLQKLGIPNKVDPSILGDNAPGLLNFNGSLFPQQVDVAEAFMASTKDPLKMGGILELPCGFGKTTITLNLLHRIGRKAIVICHKEFLMNQWRERIKGFLPDASIGLIQQDKADVKGRDIVLCSLQSLAQRTYPKEVFSGFGVIVADECHHIAAEVFSRAMPKITCAISIGLSATLERKDGLTNVIRWFLGSTIYEISNREGVEVNVHQVRYYDPDPEYCDEIYVKRNVISVPLMVNKVISYAPRNGKLIDEIRRLNLIKDPNRKVLILSERRKHLNTIENLLVESGEVLADDVGYYVGGMTEAQHKASSLKKVILATGQIASEGFDVPALNTLVLASPPMSAAIKQVVGRILRGHQSRDTKPVVLDFVDDFSIFRRYASTRASYYRENGYKILNEHGDEVVARKKAGGNKKEKEKAKEMFPTECLFQDD